MTKNSQGKPQTFSGDLANLPAALAPLCKIDHWVLWRWVQRKGMWAKPPFMAAAPKCSAKNNDSTTWSSYQAAVAAVGKADGIGFNLLDTSIVAVDLDHCLSGDEIDPWAKAWINAANGAYIERTPSGEGLRIIGLGTGEKLHRKWTVKGAREGAAIEIYRNAERYITITGAQVGDCEELAPINLLEKIKTYYEANGNADAKTFDFNTVGAAGSDDKINWDNVIQNGAPEGCDVSALFHSVIGHLAAKNMLVDQIVDELSKWPNGIARRYAGRLRGEVERSSEKWRSKRKIHIDEDAKEPEEPQEWESRDKNGIPKPTLANARRAIEALKVECRLDVFHDKPIITGKVVARLTNIDQIVADLRRKVHATWGFDPGKHNMLDATEQLCIKNKFNPILDYLNALKWDGKLRLECWLITYLGAKDTELNREFGRLALIAAVRRVRRPGTKFDPIIVLEGPMGTQKSKAVEVLAGSENFSDQTILGARDKEAQELLAGIWLFEIAELSNIRRTEVEHIKAFASRTVDRARPAYGRTRVDQPRRCVLFATTNNDEYLKESDRRFWPVKTAKIDIEALKRDRDQLWAEAATQERGASIVLREDLWGAARVEQDARQDHDPWDDKLIEASGTVEGGIERASTKDLLEIALGIHINRQRDVDYKRLSKCMRRLGWDGPRVIRINDELVRGYERKKP